MKKKIVLICIAAVIVLIVLIGLFNRQSNNKVRIAINLPLTGPVAAITGNYPKGLKMGIDEACKEYSLDSSSIEVIIDDNKASPAESASVYRRQTMKRINAFISGTTEAATVILPQTDGQDGASNFLIAFDAFLTKGGKQRFRLFPSFKTESEMWVSYITKIKPKRVATLTLNIPATEEQFSTIICPFIAKTGAEIFRERFDFSTTDFRTIALRIKENKPDVVLVSGYSFHLNVAIKALQELTVVPNEKIMCSMDFCDFLAEKRSKKALAGIAFAAPNFIVNSGNPQVREWIQRFEKRYGIAPTYTEAYAYDLGYLFVRSLHSSGDIRPSSLLKATPFDGVTGTVKFDADRDSACSLSLVKINSSEMIEAVK